MNELVDAFQRAWTSAGAFAALCEDDVHYEDPLLPEPLTGPEALERRAAELRDAFPDVRLEATGPRMTSGRHVAAPLKLVGTHEPTRRFAVVHAVVVCELHPERARLWRVRPFVDLWSGASQLGLIPDRGSVGERALLLLRGFGLRA